MADRKSWLYVEVTADEQAALKRMAKAENKSKDAIVQEMLAPAVTAEVKEFLAKEKEAADKAAAEKAKADAEKAAAAPAPTATPDTASAPSAPNFTGAGVK